MNQLRSLFLILLMGISHQVVHAQDQDLQESVHQVIDKYQEADALKLDFEFQITFPEQDPQIFQGTFFKRGDQYKVDLDDYAIYSDGTTQYTVQKKVKEVQITSIDLESVELSSPAGILKYLHNQDFKYFDKSGLNQSSSIGSRLKIIELIPTDKSSEYFKIRFSYQDAGNILKHVEIFAKDGQRIQLTTGETSFSGNFSQESILWNDGLYEDYYIEDLRID